MASSPTYYRTPHDVYEDGFLLQVDQRGNAQESVRRAAILEVARRLRESDFRALERHSDVAGYERMGRGTGAPPPAPCSARS